MIEGLLSSYSPKPEVSNKVSSASREKAGAFNDELENVSSGLYGAGDDIPEDTIEEERSAAVNAEDDELTDEGLELAEGELEEESINHGILDLVEETPIEAYFAFSDTTPLSEEPIPDPRFHLNPTTNRARITVEEQIARTQSEQINAGEAAEEQTRPTPSIFRHSDKLIEEQELMQRYPSQHLEEVEAVAEDSPANRLRQQREILKAMSNKAADGENLAQGALGGTNVAGAEGQKSSSAMSAGLAAAFLAAEKRSASSEAASEGLDIPQQQSFDTLLSNGDEAMASSSTIKGIASVESIQAARETASSTPIDLEQIVSQIRTSKDEGINEMTLQLRPDHLGQLNLRVRQDGDRLSVEMIVDNPIAKQLIEANFNDLKNRFLEKELNFTDMNLNVNIDHRSAADQFGETPYQGRFEEDYQAAQQQNRLQDNIPVSETYPRRNNETGLNLYV